MEGKFRELRLFRVLGSSHARLPPLQAFNDDELCGGGLLAQLLERGVLRRVVPFAKALHALELKDDQALGLPVALERLDCAPRARYLPP